MKARHLLLPIQLAGVGLGVVGCARLGYERALGLEDDPSAAGRGPTWDLDGGALAAGGSSTMGGPTSLDADASLGGTESGSGGSGGSGGSPNTMDAGLGGTADAMDAATPSELPENCNALPYSVRSGFDTDVEGWKVSAEADFPRALGWVAADGQPSASGVARIEADPGSLSVFFNLPMTATDLSASVLSMRLQVASGQNVRAKPYAQTGASFIWADGGSYALSEGQWVCVSFDLAAPDFAVPGYDSREVVEVGVELAADSAFTVLVDEARH